MNRPDLIPLASVAVLTTIAAVTDLWRLKVYNWLTLPALVAGLVSGMMGGLHGFGSSLLGAGVGFGVLVVFFALGGVGAGDVKLWAAVGAWLGPVMTYQVFAASAIAAGVYALALALLGGDPRRVFAEVHLLSIRMLSPSLWSRPGTAIRVEVARKDRRRRVVPFAAMTCVGFFVMASTLKREIESSRNESTVIAAKTSLSLTPGGIP